MNRTVAGCASAIDHEWYQADCQVALLRAIVKMCSTWDGLSRCGCCIRKVRRLRRVMTPKSPLGWCRQVRRVLVD
jgi:hypothetical protein